MKLREMSLDDMAIIKGWPAYPDEFEDLDYALREEGWIDEFSGKAGTTIFTGEENKIIAGFTILSKDSSIGTLAEFRIAINPAMLGLGLGKELARMTLKKGFQELRLNKIYLIVRKNNRRAKQLYERLGFRYSGECQKEIHGMIVDLFEMTLEKENFERSMKG
ncbi:MAG TPA: GNAT family N-acetyltransferase [Methanotrichaceae archaeon]|nr:GNAT family N-acetyltransferase [Methanotrichaceae archaeon]